MDTKISLKLLVDGSAKKVLFAEASKDFVDFLFGLLELPLGALITPLLEKPMADESKPLVNIYHSVQNLDPSFYLQPSQAKSVLLSPTTPSNTKHTPLLSLLFGSSSSSSSSSSNSGFFHPLDSPPHNPFFFEPRSFDQQVEGGYVKGTVSYMVMDDLKVKPMSTISSITLLNTFQVKDIGCLQEKTVEVDIAKGLELVRASFGSTAVLTDIFLGKEEEAIFSFGRR